MKMCSSPSHKSWVYSNGDHLGSHMAEKTRRSLFRAVSEIVLID